MHKATILSVDDDENLQVVISEFLESNGYKVLTAIDTAQALEKADSLPIDVVLLDLMLSNGEEGLSLIPQFRTKSQAGIIVVSGKSDTTEKVVCLEMGADDYLTKPFEMRELSARIKAILRRTEHQIPSESTKTDSEEKIGFEGKWILDRTQYQLLDHDNNSLDLTTGEFKLLEALVLAPNRAISREHLFELTRDGEFDAYDRAIDIQIGRIRKKLNVKNADEIIRTVRGVGYMFTGKKDSKSDK